MHPIDDFDGEISEPVDVTLAGLGGDPDSLARAQRALEPIKAALTAAGYYAYTTFDDEARWSVAVDDEAGRVDVRIGEDGFVVEITGTSPGLFADEDNDWKRRAHERLARMLLPNVNRGMLQPHQLAFWDEVEQGVAVRLTYELPFTAGGQIGPFVQSHLAELDDVIALVESQVVA